MFGYLVDQLITFVTSQASVHNGGDVTLTCYIEGKGLFDIVRMSRTVAMVAGVSEIISVISNNDALGRDYKDTGRHEIVRVIEKPVAVYKLTISSKYGCVAGQEGQ